MIAEEDESQAAVLRNPLEDLFGYQLRRAAAAMLADLGRRIASLGLTVTEISVLMLIEQNPQITQSEIGRILAIKRANMTPLAAGLLGRELISRRAVNGRSHGLTLTESGSALVAEARLRIAENEARLLIDVPKSDRGRLIELLRSVWSRTDQM